MNFRYKFSIVLVILGIISAIMSFGGTHTSEVLPEHLLSALVQGNSQITAAQLAEIIGEEDSAYQIVDVRSADQYKLLSLPGARSIQLSEILNTENEAILRSNSVNTIFYSGDSGEASQAWILSMQKGYDKVLFLKGGLDEWDTIIMKSAFDKEKITAAENKLFETRFKARRLYTQWNAMPDSLKAGFFAQKQIKDKELVGGCE